MGIFFKLLGNPWILGVVGAIVVGSGVWIWGNGRLAGFEKGYDKAEAAYRQQVTDAINNTVTRRDEQWAALMEQIKNEIERVNQQNERTAEQENQLQESLERLESALEQSRERIRSSNLGECRLTPEFDSLFDEAASAPTQP